MRIRAHVRLLGAPLLSTATVFAMLGVHAASQQAPPSPPPSQSPPSSAQPQAAGAADDRIPRLRIDVTAVEIDAVVTGTDGKPITDLRPEEFQILQDGRKQQVMSARYVPLDPPSSSPATPTPTRAEDIATLPPSSMPRPEDVRHTLAVVVDDLNMSFISTARTREALKNFVTRDVKPGDVVAILRTGRGVGRFQPFTNDRRVLLQAVSNLHYNTMQDVAFRNEFTGETRSAVNTEESFTRDVLTSGSLGAVAFVIRGMREMPGRKSVVLISDGWSLTYREQVGAPVINGTGQRSSSSFQSTMAFETLQPRIMEAMQRLIDEANRSFVVIYTLDSRGLVVPDLHMDQSGPPHPGSFSREAEDLYNSQGGPQMLASMAGGFYIHGTNGLSKGLTRVMDDQRGYYLIGYQPDDQTFKKEKDHARFHTVTVKVTRKGAKVRARTGFYGVTDEQTRPKPPATRNDRLLEALTKPFSTTDVGLQATTLFWHDPSQGALVRALLHVDTSTLTFKPDADGTLAAPVDVVAALIDERGAISANKVLNFTIKGPNPLPEQMRTDGLSYAIDLPVKAPGPYQLRAAVTDLNTGKLGSANEFLIVPRVDGRRLAISGVMLQGETAAASAAAAAEAPAKERADDGEAIESAARRRFVPGMAVNYAFQVYNAERDKSTGKPALASHFRLFRDGQFVTDGELIPTAVEPPPLAGTVTTVTSPKQAEEARKRTTLEVGTMKLSDGIKPGSYDLEVAVTDTLSKKPRAVQWTNFTVTPR